MISARKIQVSEKEKNFLISREAATLLFERLESADAEVELDFSNIEFMSRSYADQFYKIKANLEQNQKTKIYVINANEEVINMLQAVAKTQNATTRFFEKTPVFRFSEPQLLSDYLLSI